MLSTVVLLFPRPRYWVLDSRDRLFCRLYLVLLLLCQVFDSWYRLFRWLFILRPRDRFLVPVVMLHVRGTRNFD